MDMLSEQRRQLDRRYASGIKGSAMFFVMPSRRCMMHDSLLWRKHLQSNLFDILIAWPIREFNMFKDYFCLRICGGIRTSKRVPICKSTARELLRVEELRNIAAAGGNAVRAGSSVSLNDTFDRLSCIFSLTGKSTRCDPQVNTSTKD